MRLVFRYVSAGFNIGKDHQLLRRSLSIINKNRASLIDKTYPIRPTLPQEGTPSKYALNIEPQIEHAPSSSNRNCIINKIHWKY